MTFERAREPLRGRVARHVPDGTKGAASCAAKLPRSSSARGRKSGREARAWSARCPILTPRTARSIQKRSRMRTFITCNSVHGRGWRRKEPVADARTRSAPGGGAVTRRARRRDTG